MNMSNEWELVVKGGKHKAQSKISNKEQKRINQNNLNSNKYRLALDEDTDKSLSPEQDKISNKSKPKKNNTVKTETDINKQINKISSDSIMKVYSELLEKFPNQYTVSLLDLAVHLNLMIKTNEESLKTINFEQLDFPFAFLSNDAKTALKNIFNKLSNVHISSFLKSAMIQFLDDHDKGIQSIGLRILIQSCVRMKSTIFITHRKEFFDLLNHYREQTAKFKLLTWIIRQACSNYNMACQIWLIYFLPFITQKCHTEFVITFGEEMRNYSADPTGNDTTLLVNDFVPIIDLIFSQSIDAHQNDRKSNKRKQTNFQLTANQVTRLKAIYPRIKDQAFLSKSSGALKDYFGSLFLRLSGNSRNALLNKELLDCLDHCLKMCPESISHLSYLHLEYPQQTKIFLDHLSSPASGDSNHSASAQKSKIVKSVIDKVILQQQQHSSATLLRTGDDNSRRPNKTPSQISSCMGTVFRTISYLVVLLALIGGLLYWQYPRQFRELQSRLQPHIDTAIDRLTPAFVYCQSTVVATYKWALPHATAAAQVIQTKSVELWTSLRPVLNDAAVRVVAVMHYLQAKIDEIFPTLAEQVGQMVHSAKDYIVRLANAVVDYVNSPEFHSMLKMVADKLAGLAQQFESAYRSAVNYTMAMLGN